MASHRLLEQLERAERQVAAVPSGLRESHPVWQELQERRRSQEAEQRTTSSGQQSNHPRPVTGSR
jgi:hypothetical protein